MTWPGQGAARSPHGAYPLFFSVSWVVTNIEAFAD